MRISDWSSDVCSSDLNAFSPNADGQNDVLQVKDENCDYPSFSLQIFDRWGNKVFETFDMKTSWNGKNKNNQELDPGVYVFKCVYSTAVEESKTMAGNVSLVR